MASIDWDAISDKMNTELTTTNQDLMTSSFKTNGNEKTYRSFADMASLKTIANNTAATQKNEDSGMMIFAEMDWNI